MPMLLFITRRKEKKNNYNYWIIYASLFIFSFFFTLFKVIEIIYQPPGWDFSAFYLFGKVAVRGYNFYLPDSLKFVFNNLHLPPISFDSFAGFPYPPPTMLLFMPLGFLSYDIARIVWLIFVLLSLLGSMFLSYNLYFKEYKLRGILLVATLFFFLPPVQSTIFYSQTNFILLFLLLLMKKYSNRNFVGIFLTLAIFVKPFMVIFAFVPILRKQWKFFIYTILSSLLLIGITALIFGTEPFMTYLLNNPVKRIPSWVFSEDINQSLQAVLIRHNFITMDKPLIYLYILSCVFLITVFYLFFYLLKRILYDYIWAVLLLVSLMLYPGTLSHYGVLLLFIIFQLFNEKKQLGFSMYLSIPIIGIFYYLSSVSLFSSISFLLIIIIIKSFLQWKSNNPTLVNSSLTQTNLVLEGI